MPTADHGNAVKDFKDSCIENGYVLFFCFVFENSSTWERWIVYTPVEKSQADRGSAVEDVVDFCNDDKSRKWGKKIWNRKSQTSPFRQWIQSLQSVRFWLENSPDLETMGCVHVGKDRRYHESVVKDKIDSCDENDLREFVDHETMYIHVKKEQRIPGERCQGYRWLLQWEPPLRVRRPWTGGAYTFLRSRVEESIFFDRPVIHEAAFSLKIEIPSKYFERPTRLAGTVDKVSELKECNNKIDTWAMGVILYYLTYDHHPWKFAINPWRDDSKQCGQFAFRIS